MRDAEFETLHYEAADGVAWGDARPNRRAQRLQPPDGDRAPAGVADPARDAEVRCVVLTGRGRGLLHRHRSRRGDGPPAGGSRCAPAGRRTPDVWHLEDPGRRIGPKSNDLWKPVIAAVNGMACGGAFYLLGEVEFIIAAEHATFFDPHVTYGMTACLESMHMLQKMPFHEIMRLALLGAHERVPAQRAYEIGLVSEVVPRTALNEAARRVATVDRVGAPDRGPRNRAVALDRPRAVACASPRHGPGASSGWAPIPMTCGRVRPPSRWVSGSRRGCDDVRDRTPLTGAPLYSWRRRCLSTSRRSSLRDTLRSSPSRSRTESSATARSCPCSPTQWLLPARSSGLPSCSVPRGRAHIPVVHCTVGALSRSLRQQPQRAGCPRPCEGRLATARLLRPAPRDRREARGRGAAPSSRSLAHDEHLPRRGASE